MKIWKQLIDFVEGNEPAPAAPEPPEPPIPVEIFSGQMDRNFSPHFCDDERMRVYMPAWADAAWPNLIRSGMIADFVAARRQYSNWPGGGHENVPHPFIQFYAYPPDGVSTYGLSRFDSRFPDNGRRLSGKIAVEEGDAVLCNDGTLVMSGVVRVYCALGFSRTERYNRVYPTVTITPTGGIILP